MPLREPDAEADADGPNGLRLVRQSHRGGSAARKGETMNYRGNYVVLCAGTAQEAPNIIEAQRMAEQMAQRVDAPAHILAPMREVARDGTTGAVTWWK